jgi:hypothetical protein
MERRRVIRAEAARAIAALAVLAACGGSAMAQEEPPKMVSIKGLKDPELRSFRSVTAGLDTFDEYHRFAPAVTALRFRLKPREATEDKSTEGITLTIVGKGEPIPVTIEPDGGFTIARNEAAYDDDADLMFNRKRRQFISIADIRTPGLPGNVRRLGDLRLECKVNIAIVKTEIPLWARAMLTTFLLTPDWCKKLPIFFSLPPLGKLGKTTLVHQDRKRELTREELENGFESPMLDPVAWPDDTLLEMELVTPD